MTESQAFKTWSRDDVRPRLRSWENSKTDYLQIKTASELCFVSVQAAQQTATAWFVQHCRDAFLGRFMSAWSSWQDSDWRRHHLQLCLDIPRHRLGMHISVRDVCDTWTLVWSPTNELCLASSTLQSAMQLTWQYRESRRWLQQRFFLLTQSCASAVYAMLWCLCVSVTNWMDRAGFWHRGYCPLILQCTKGEFGYLQKTRVPLFGSLSQTQNLDDFSFFTAACQLSQVLSA